MPLSADEIYQDAISAGFAPGQQATTITAISLAESGGNPTNVNTNYATDPGGSYGLTQVNAAAHPGMMQPNIYDPVANLQDAYQISGGGTNFSPWSTYNNGAYQSFLPQAQSAAGNAGNGAGLTAGAVTTDSTSAIQLPPVIVTPDGTTVPTGTTSQMGGATGTTTPSTTAAGSTPTNIVADVSPSGSGTASPLAGTVNNSAVTSAGGGLDLFNTLLTSVWTMFQRGGLIILGLIMVAAGAWAIASHSEAAQTVRREVGNAAKFM